MLSKAARHWGFGLFTFLAVSSLGLAQGALDWPNSRATVAGSDTVLDHTLSADARVILGAGSHANEVLLRLPSVNRAGVAELAGMLRQGTDIEIFLGWFTPESGVHIEVFRGRPGTEAAFVHDFSLMGGPFWHVHVFQPPDAMDTPKVLVDTYAGSTYSNTYLLAPDRQSAEKLFDGSDYTFADLDGDGIYELIVLDGRWSTPEWCIDLFGFSFFPRIFVRDGDGYRMAWPLDGEANFRVAAARDLRGDGAAELVVLQDNVGTSQPTTPAVALYALDHNVFRLLAQAPLPAGRIAFTEIGFPDSLDGRGILVRTASPSDVVQPPDALARANEVHEKSQLAQCDPQAAGTSETAYILRANRLEPAPR